MEYEIVGGNLPVLKIKLTEGESVITEAGAMSWMTPNIKMNTSSHGGVGRALGRFFSGESLFQNAFTCKKGNGEIVLSTHLPGSILALGISKGKSIIAQKSAFLASEVGVDFSIYFQKKLASGFFGGEGFIMQKLSGEGTVFLEIDGYCQTVDLERGEEIIVGTGHLAAMEETCKMNVQTVPGIKNIFFGGEGFFLTKVTGPGRVYLQGMPISGVAGALAYEMNLHQE